MRTDWLPLFIAPIAVGVLLLLLQQLLQHFAKQRLQLQELRTQLVAAQNEAAEAKRQLAYEAERHRSAITAVQQYYENKIQGKEQDIARSHQLIALLSPPTERDCRNIIPGCDTGG